MANSEPQKTLEDLVDHVRWVHFGLVATCISLLIANHSQRVDSIQNAIRDIRRIESLAPLFYQDAFTKEVIQPYLKNDGLDLSGDLTKTITISAPERSETALISVDYPLVKESPSLLKIYEALQPKVDTQEVSEEVSNHITSKNRSNATKQPNPADQVTLDAFRAVWDAASVEPSSEIFPSVSLAPSLKKGSGKFLKVSKKNEIKIDKDPIDLSKSTDVTPEISDKKTYNLAAIFDPASNQTRKMTNIDFAYDSVSASALRRRACFFSRDDSKNLLIRIWHATTGNVSSFKTDIPASNSFFGLSSIGIKSQVTEGDKQIAFACRNRSRSLISYDVMIGQLDTQSMKEVDVLPGRAPLAFSSDGSILAHCGKLGTGLFAWSLNAHSKPKELKCFLLDTEVLGIVALNNSNFVVVGNRYDAKEAKATMATVNYNSGTSTRVREWTEKAVSAQLALDSDGNRCFVALALESQKDSKQRINLTDVRVADKSLVSSRDLPLATQLGSMSVSDNGEAVAVSHDNGVTILDSTFTDEHVYQQFGSQAELLFYDKPQSLAVFQKQRGNADGEIHMVRTSPDALPIEGLLVYSENFNGDEQALDWLLFVPGETSGTTNRRLIQIQDAFATKAQADWKHGSFETSFPDLTKTATDRFNLPISNLRRSLEKEAELSGASVEPFGISVPAWAIRRVGALFLLCVQFYLWRHLVAIDSLDGRDSKSVTTRWIGLYRDWWSRVAVVLTIVVLPAVTTVTLLWEPMFSNRWNEAPVSIVEAVASISIAFLAWGCLINLNERANGRIAKLLQFCSRSIG